VSRPRRQRASKDRKMALYVLLAMVVALVIYLFYAVIHPEKF
jgi:K+-transporting ATPase KdpF subunit